jgi:Ser/Thr protein kinase RdoA (MazF antagonist)
MGSLFKPDIFSNPVPAFSPVRPEAVDAVMSAYERMFGSAPVSSIEQFGGNEVNSNNFKIVLESGRKLLLKRLPGSAKSPVMRRQLALIEWLAEKGTAIAPLLRSVEGRPFESWHSAYWCGFEFVDGNFFEGGLDQVEQASKAIGDMQLALSGVPESIVPPAKWDYDYQRLKAAADDMFARSSEWVGFFGEEGAASLSEAWQPRVLPALAQVEEMGGLLERSGVAVCHADLHPHNLLMGDGQFGAVIDFESFTRMPIATALGFATYKLMRQHCVAQGMDEADEAKIAADSRIFIDGVATASGRGEAAHNLQTGAVIELYRRMTIIFRLNLDQQNTAWNHVLTMHLNGLEEIPLIFGSP